MNFIADKKLAKSRDARRSAAFSAVGMILGGYEPGFELTGGSHPNAIERFVVLCVRGSPRLLLPPQQPVMRSAIASFLGNRGLASVMAPFVQIASWAGGPFSRVISDVSLTSRDGAPSPLRELITNALNRNDFQIALRLSFGRPNAKTVAVAISNSGEALCFAKFGSEAMTNDLVAHESAILEKFEGTDIPIVMPRRLYSGTWAGGHNVLITSPLKLDPLKRDVRSAHQAADTLASSNIVASSTLSESKYWFRVIEDVEKFSADGNDNRALLSYIRGIERIWGDCTFDFGVSHGDWTRANLGMVGEQVAALDWERCTMNAPRGIDVAHFDLYESSFISRRKSLDVNRATESVRQYLGASDLPPENAEPLVMLALLEMVIRFKSAQNAGLRSADLKFGPALEAGLRKRTS